MATTAGQILRRAATILQDETFVRWPLPELADWLNEAQRAIVQAKPSANSASVVLTLVQGTLQSLTNPDHLLLLRLPRNLKSSSPRYGGRIIRPTTREEMDASEPSWHDPDVLPLEKEVRQYIYDEENPREFYVYPGNDGTGLVEALVSVLPAMIATTSTDIAAYDVLPIGLPEPYAPVILDYILFRAFAKDDFAADVTRSRLHYQSFAQALGLKVQAETANSPNVKAGVQRT